MGLKQPLRKKKTFWGVLISIVFVFITSTRFIQSARAVYDNREGIVSWVVFVVLAPWFPLTIGLVCLSVLLWSSHRLERKLEQHAEDYYVQFIKAWDGLRMTRRIFEEKIGSLYATWSKNPSDLNAIKALVYRAGCPERLPPTKEHIWQYARRALAEWKGDPGTLLDFCAAVYARRGNQLMPDLTEWDAFDEIRMELSKFWNEWGAKCFNEQVMEEKRMLAKVPGQDWQILLLIYLEIARAYHYESTGPGKEWLFQLGTIVPRW